QALPVIGFRPGYGGAQRAGPPNTRQHAPCQTSLLVSQRLAFGVSRMRTGFGAKGVESFKPLPWDGLLTWPPLLDWWFGSSGCIVDAHHRHWLIQRSRPPIAELLISTGSMRIGRTRPHLWSRLVILPRLRFDPFSFHSMISPQAILLPARI